MDRSRKFLKALLLTLVFTGFPLLLSDFALEYIWDVRDKTREEAEFQNLDARLTRYQPLAVEDAFLRAFLTRFCHTLESDPNGQARFQRKVPRIHQRYPGLFSFTFIDARGVVRYQDSLRDGRRIPELLFSILRLPVGNKRETELLRGKKLFAQYLGCPMNTVKQLILERELIRTSGKGVKTWFFHSIGKNGSLFVHIHRQGYPLMMPFKRLVKGGREPGFVMHLLDTRTGQVFGDIHGFSPRVIRRVTRFHDQQPENHFRFAARLWSVLMIDSRFRLFASVPDTVRSEREVFFSRFHLLAGSFFGLVLVALWVIQGRPPLYVSLRWKTVFLFFFASGLPMLVLAFTGFVYLQERERSLKQEAWKHMNTLLRNVDRKFPLAMNQVQVALKKELSQADLNTQSGLARLTRNLFAFQESHFSNSFKMVASASEVFLIRDNTNQDPSRQFIMALLKGILNRLNGVDQTDFSTGGTSRNAVLEEFFGTDLDTLVDGVLPKLGTVFKIDYTFLTWYIYLEALGKANSPFRDYVFAATWDEEELRSFYFQKCSSLQGTSDGTKLFALELDTHKWEKKKIILDGRFRGWRNLHSYYPPVPLSPSLKRFFRLMMRTRQAQTGEVEYQGTRSLVSGIMGSQLEDNALVAVRPITPVLAEIRNLRDRLILFGILALLVTGALAFLISAKFLQPVQSLSQGLLAVEQRLFRFRLPGFDADELGDLAQLFNRMMASLEELDTAKIVQEKLFPHETLISSDFRVAGFSSPATELGGDFYDYHLWGENRILVVIGDVTGHGVPAALLMSLAKGVIMSMGRKGIPVEDILASLGHVIHQTMHQRLMMTMGVFLFDTDTGLGNFWSCGHPFPFLQKVSGDLAEIEQGGLPLGAFSKFQNKSRAVKLEPGERIILYTDGLAESLDQGKMEKSGYDFLKDYFDGQPIQPAEEACRNLIRQHPAILSGLPQPDDFTVVVIERVGNGGSGPLSP